MKIALPFIILTGLIIFTIGCNNTGPPNHTSSFITPTSTLREQLLAEKILTDTRPTKPEIVTGTQALKVDLPFTNTVWRLATSHVSKKTAAENHETFELVFQDDGNLQAQVVCNTCRATYTATTTNSLTIFPLLCTHRFCGTASKEKDFLSALGTVTAYEIKGRQLRLIYNEGTARLNFIARK